MHVPSHVQDVASFLLGLKALAMENLAFLRLIFLLAAFIGFEGATLRAMFFAFFCARIPDAAHTLNTCFLFW